MVHHSTPPCAQIIVVVGGVRSGKSRFALQCAEGLGPRRGFIATAQAFDDEMTERITRHRQERDASYTTVEEPIELAQALAGFGTEPVDVVVVDCLTLWLSNLLLKEESFAQIEARLEAVIAVLEQRAFHTILISNEVGMGVVPPSALGRQFRDLAGLTHQRLGRCADALYGAMFGVVMRLKPGPIELVSSHRSAS